MNRMLYCNKLKLWETPTHVTFMCMMQPDGSIAPTVLRGEAALHALYLYKIWIVSILNGSTPFESHMDASEYLERLLEHVEDINKVIEDKDLEIDWA